MLGLKDIETKTIRLYLSHLDYRNENSINEFCFFYIDLYYTASLIFVIVSPEGQKVEHPIESDETLTNMIDRFTEDRRKKFLFGKYEINEEIKHYLKHKLESKNKIVYEKDYCYDYKSEKKQLISKKKLKGYLAYIIISLVLLIIAFLYVLIFGRW